MVVVGGLQSVCLYLFIYVNVGLFLDQRAGITSQTPRPRCGPGHHPAVVRLKDTFWCVIAASALTICDQTTEEEKPKSGQRRIVTSREL